MTIENYPRLSDDHVHIFPERLSVADKSDKLRILQDRVRLLEVALLKEKDVSRLEGTLEGMLSKNAILEHIETKIRENVRFGLFNIDINNFKSVNDKLGHSVGDRLLSSFATNLDKSFGRMTDKMAIHEGIQFLHEKGRVGGDEFLIFIEIAGNDQRSQDPIDQMDNAYGMIRRAMDNALDENPQCISVGAGISIGSIVYDPKQSELLPDILLAADQAMYDEKDFLRARNRN